MSHPARGIIKRLSAHGKAEGYRQYLEQQWGIFDSAVSAIADFAYAFDREGHLLYASRLLLDLWGLTLEDAAGKNFYDLQYPDELAERLQQQIQEVFSTGKNTADEISYISSARGVAGHYEYIFRPITGADGTIELVAGSIRDITRRKTLETTLRQHEQELTAMMAKLTASLAHEIKQPLSAIMMNGDFCLRQLANPDPDLGQMREAIVEIVNDGDRASSIFSKMQPLMTQKPPERTEVNIHDLVREVVQIVRQELDRDNILFQNDLAVDLPLILGDRGQLQQVFINVVMNSIEALRAVSGTVREIRATAVAAPDCVHIQISDSGPGVDPDTAERIFTPFFTTKHDGMGLGLSISRYIAESNGGHIRIMPGSRGGLFEITFSQKTGNGQ